MMKIIRALTNQPLISSFLVLVISGLSLKRWLVMEAFGLAAVGIGIVFALQFSLGPGFHSFVGTLSLRDTAPAIRGGVFIALGLVVAEGDLDGRIRLA